MEKDLDKKCPECGLKVKPHIESKLKFWREQHGIVFDMLNQSGFGWNEDRRCVEVVDGADRAILSAYLKSHKGAKKWVNKEFIYFERLGVIFGKDRATGKGAEAPVDAVEELDREGNDVSDDGDQTINSVNQNVHVENNVEGSHKKRCKGGEALAEGLVKVVHIFGSYFDKSSERLDCITEKLGHGKRIYDDQRNVPEELEKMGLSIEDMIEVGMKIMDKPQNVHLFWGFKGDARVAFVQHLLAK